MSDQIDTRQLWKSIGAAIGAELREATTIRGLSGQDHSVQAIAVDDKTSRVVIFSAEASPRLASLMQADVQATIPDAHVLVARPVIFDISEVTRRIINAFGSGALNIPEVAKLIQTSSKHKKKVERQTNIFNEKVGPVSCTRFC